MKTFTLIIAFALSIFLSNAQSNRIEFTTAYGKFNVLLYDFTPDHRDLILSSLSNNLYKGALFNRIIEGFVIQGGDHDIDIEKYEAQHPEGGKPRLAPEFDQRAYHKLGALGAGRDGNNEKASFLKQIYFVVGSPVSTFQLDSLEKAKGIKYTDQQRDTYLKTGGQPRLDHDFTVFGEVYEGLEVLIEMSRVKTNSQDYPIQEIPFTFHIIHDDATAN